MTTDQAARFASLVTVADEAIAERVADLNPLAVTVAGFLFGSARNDPEGVYDQLVTLSAILAPVAAFVTDGTLPDRGRHAILDAMLDKLAAGATS